VVKVVMTGPGGRISLCFLCRNGKFSGPLRLLVRESSGSKRIEKMSDYETRFGGMARLYGAAGLKRLRAAHVCVVGIGGVGSWTAEALARSGLGKLTLVDLDDVCVSNINRQIHALNGNVGRAKVQVMAERIRAINPECEALTVPEFFTGANAASLLGNGFDFVVDAIDNVPNKCLLIAAARERNIPIVACGGAGGRRDATAVRVGDLALTTHDRLLQKVREILRKEHGFPPVGKEFGVDCVYSPEPPVFPVGDGSVCENRALVGDTAGNKAPRLNCDWGLGSASFVTGVFGFAAAGVVVKKLSELAARPEPREDQ
jgi:tRNA A37 threonylcarbamoyladenosine dehydratase